MVPGSRVNHPEQIPPQIEIEVYHFSAAQAVVSGTSTTTDNTHYQKNGSGAVVYASCFIDTAAAGNETGFISLLGLLEGGPDVNRHAETAYGCRDKNKDKGERIKVKG